MDLALFAVVCFGLGYIAGFGKGQGQPAQEAGPLALLGLFLAGAAVGRIVSKRKRDA